MAGESDRNHAESGSRTAAASCNAGDDYLGCTLPPDPQLLSEGWERRFVADARRSQEAVETYGELGFEVRLEPLDTQNLKDECSGCLLALAQFHVVYTRKRT